MRKLTLFSIVFIAIITLISCDSDPVIIGTIEDATIVWGGDPSEDGCGWLVKTSDSTYKPDEIPLGFEVNNLKVVINYQNLNTTYVCGWSLGMSNIHIISIKLKSTN